MFSRVFKLLVGLSVLFGLSKKANSKKNKTVKDFEFLDQPSDKFTDAITDNGTQDSVTFVPSQEQSKDINNNFNQEEDSEIFSPG